MKNSYKNLIKSHFNEHALVLQSTSLNMIDILEKLPQNFPKCYQMEKNFGAEMEEVHQTVYIFQQNL